MSSSLRYKPYGHEIVSQAHNRILDTASLEIFVTLWNRINEFPKVTGPEIRKRSNMCGILGFLDLRRRI